MGRTIVITGSASGIGAATMKRLERKGHRVIGVDIRDAEVIGDLSHKEGRQAAMAKVRSLAPDGIDGILASAGTSDINRPDLTLSTNYFGTTEFIEGLYGVLRKPGARCVAVASAGLLQSNERTAKLEQLCLEGNEAEAVEEAKRIGTAETYPGTKHAVTVWARHLAVKPEWAGQGVLLNIVAPGMILTPMTEASEKIPELREKVRKTAPRVVEKMGQPEEVAELMDFLLNCESGYIVGQVIFIDGGTEAILRADL